MKKTIDTIAQWAALISAAYVFIGIFRAILYYLPFHIPVHTYIDLGEVFTIWFPYNFLNLFGPFIFGVLIFFIKSTEPEHKDGFYYYHAMVYLMHGIVIGFLFSDLIFNCYDRYSLERMDFVKPFWMLLGLVAVIGLPFLMSGLFQLVNAWRKRETSFSTKKLRMTTIINICFMMFYIFYYFIYDPLATDITSVNATEYVEMIRSDGKKIVTDNNVRYLGKTRNYIFLWDKKSKTSFIYKSDQFEEIKSSSNKFKN